MRKVEERFLQYVKIDTTSDPESKTTPSSTRQFDLAKRLIAELEDIGISSARLDNNGYVIASIPANTDEPIPPVGFIAHIDTSPDMEAKNVKPQIHRNYDGGDIVLNEKQQIVLSPEEFPELKDYVNQDIITSDGTTLLGADDKAGIAEIMTAVEYLIENPDVKHGKIFIAFTPDEEIGQGTKYFNVDKFKADFAYTMDGGAIGSLEYENFNAAKAKVYVNGRNVHPGTAKNKMINALQVAIDFHQKLPADERPENTEGYEGFFHLTNLNGTVEQATIQYIIRDHDRMKFEKKKNFLKHCASEVNEAFRKEIITIDMEDQYFNMREKIEPVRHIVSIAEAAMRRSDIEPRIQPIRGGTDGDHLSYLGLPTPNIFTGGHNFHGAYEYIPIQSMNKGVEVILNIIDEIASGKHFKQ